MPEGPTIVISMLQEKSDCVRSLPETVGEGYAPLPFTPN